MRINYRDKSQPLVRIYRKGTEFIDRLGHTVTIIVVDFSKVQLINLARLNRFDSVICTVEDTNNIRAEEIQPFLDNTSLTLVESTTRLEIPEEDSVKLKVGSIIQKSIDSRALIAAIGENELLLICLDSGNRQNDFRVMVKHPQYLSEEEVSKLTNNQLEYYSLVLEDGTEIPLTTRVSK